MGSVKSLVAGRITAKAVKQERARQLKLHQRAKLQLQRNDVIRKIIKNKRRKRR